MHTFDIIDIQENIRTGGWWCHFSVAEEHFYADLSEVWGTPEFMVFEADKNGKVLSWAELDVQHPKRVASCDLMNCVYAFVEKQQRLVG